MASLLPAAEAPPRRLLFPLDRNLDVHPLLFSQQQQQQQQHRHHHLQEQHQFSHPPRWPSEPPASGFYVSPAASLQQLPQGGFHAHALQHPGLDNAQQPVGLAGWPFSEPPAFAEGCLRAGLKPMDQSPSPQKPFFTGAASPPKTAGYRFFPRFDDGEINNESFAEPESPRRSPFVVDPNVAPPTNFLGEPPTDEDPEGNVAQGTLARTRTTPEHATLSTEEFERFVPPMKTTYEAVARANNGMTSTPITNSVVVFGFPQAAASYILSQFRNYGDIVRHCPAPPGKNWMTLTYAHRLGAQTALSKHGRVFGGFMVGVLPAPNTQDESTAGGNRGGRDSAGGTTPPRTTGDYIGMAEREVAEEPAQSQGAPQSRLAAPPAGTPGRWQKLAPKNAAIFVSEDADDKSAACSGRKGDDGGTGVSLYRKISDALLRW